MDKKKQIKVVVAGCFLLVCGTVYLGMHIKKREMREVVSEKQEERSDLVEEEQKKPTSGTENESSEAEAPKEILYVHICGAVTEEGVYALSAGSRVIDGISAAGGFCEGADTAYHNLAACLLDGQKIYVPTVEETKELSAEERMKGNETGFGEETVTGVHKVNINTADLDELMTLSGIGKSKAEAILRYREKVGTFQKTEEIKNVSGIGDAMFEQIKESIVAE